LDEENEKDIIYIKKYMFSVYHRQNTFIKLNLKSGAKNKTVDNDYHFPKLTVRPLLSRTKEKEVSIEILI